jgi:prepilin signal peptidase PulO-like enzyme (type II secretory pathway)
MGSFVNAFVWRLKRKKNWVSDRSICTHCKHVLAPKDLIPVVSWLLLKGKCRYCHKKIDDNPLTEISVAVLFVSSYIFWPLELNGEGWFRLIIWLIAVVLLAAMFLYDIKWMILPDKLTYSLFLLAFIQVVVLFMINDFDTSILWRSISSMLLGGVIFHLIYVLSKAKYIGGGDVKLGYAYGLLLIDPILPWLTLTVASTAGSIVAIYLLVTKRAKMGTKLPFGPFLISGVVVVVLWGAKIWDYVGQLMN